MAPARFSVIVVSRHGSRDQEHWRSMMWWAVGLGAFLYFVLLSTLGLITLRKGHWVMFIVGIFLPIFWLIGAMVGPTEAQTA
jgi:hypothetical protein